MNVNEQTTEQPTTPINLELLESLLMESNASLSNGTDKSIALFIGATGSGKSSAINFVNGGEMVKRVDDNTGAVVMENRLPENTQCFPKIGHDASETTFPRVFKDFHGKLPFLCCDTAGFGDQRGIEYDVCANFSLSMAVSAAKEIKCLVVVIEESTLDVERAQPLFKVMNLLGKLIGNENVWRSTLFLFTKGHRSHQQLLKMLTKRKNQAEKSMVNDNSEFNVANLMGYMLKYPHNIVDLKELKDRTRLVEKINSMPPLNKGYLKIISDNPMHYEVKLFLMKLATNFKYNHEGFNRVVASRTEMQQALEDERKVKEQHMEELIMIDNQVFTNDELIASLRKKLNDIDSSIKSLQDQLKKIDKSLEEHRATIAHLLQDTALIVISTDSYDERAVHGTVRAGVSNQHTFEYTVPSGSELRIANTEYKGVGSSTTGDSESFKEQVKTDQQFTLLYITPSHYYGKATLKIYSPKNLTVEVKGQIAQLEKDIAVLLAEQTKKNKSKSDLESEKSRVLTDLNNAENGTIKNNFERKAVVQRLINESEEKIQLYIKQLEQLEVEIHEFEQHFLINISKYKLLMSTSQFYSRDSVFTDFRIIFATRFPVEADSIPKFKVVDCVAVDIEPGARYRHNNNDNSNRGNCGDSTNIDSQGQDQGQSQSQGQGRNMVLNTTLTASDSTDNVISNDGANGYSFTSQLFNEQLDFHLLRNELAAEKKAVEKVKGKNIVLIIGLKESGKGSLVHFLNGGDMEVIEQSDGEKIVINNLPNCPVEYFPTLAHDRKSETTSTIEVSHNVNDPSACYCTITIGSDNIKDTMALIMILNAVRTNAKSIKSTVFVLPEDVLSTERGNLLKKYLNIMRSLFRNSEHMSKYNFFVFTRPKRQIHQLHNFIMKQVDAPQAKYDEEELLLLKLLRDYLNNIKMLTFDKRERASWLQCLHPIDEITTASFQSAVLPQSLQMKTRRWIDDQRCTLTLLLLKREQLLKQIDVDKNRLEQIVGEIAQLERDIDELLNTTTDIQSVKELIEAEKSRQLLVKKEIEDKIAKEQLELNSYLEEQRIINTNETPVEFARMSFPEVCTNYSITNWLWRPIGTLQFEKSDLPDPAAFSSFEMKEIRNETKPVGKFVLKENSDQLIKVEYHQSKNKEAFGSADLIVYIKHRFCSTERLKLQRLTILIEQVQDSIVSMKPSLDTIEGTLKKLDEDLINAVNIGEQIRKEMLEAKRQLQAALKAKEKELRQTLQYSKDTLVHIEEQLIDHIPNIHASLFLLGLFSELNINGQFKEFIDDMTERYPEPVVVNFNVEPIEPPNPIINTVIPCEHNDVSRGNEHRPIISEPVNSLRYIPGKKIVFLVNANDENSSEIDNYISKGLCYKVSGTDSKGEPLYEPVSQATTTLSGMHQQTYMFGDYDIQQRRLSVEEFYSLLDSRYDNAKKLGFTSRVKFLILAESSRTVLSVIDKLGMIGHRCLRDTILFGLTLVNRHGGPQAQHFVATKTLHARASLDSSVAVYTQRLLLLDFTDAGESREQAISMLPGSGNDQMIAELCPEQFLVSYMVITLMKCWEVNRPLISVMIFLILLTMIASCYLNLKLCIGIVLLMALLVFIFKTSIILWLDRIQAQAHVIYQLITSSLAQKNAKLDEILDLIRDNLQASEGTMESARTLLDKSSELISSIDTVCQRLDQQLLAPTKKLLQSSERAIYDGATLVRTTDQLLNQHGNSLLLKVATLMNETKSSIQNTQQLIATCNKEVASTGSQTREVAIKLQNSLPKLVNSFEQLMLGVSAAAKDGKLAPHLKASLELLPNATFHSGFNITNKLLSLF